MKVSTNEKLFIEQALQQQVRVDGRNPLDMRTIRIEFGTRLGTVQVQLGTTRVVACITGDIVPPYPDRPTEGFLNFFVDFSPMASPDFEPNKPNDKSIEAARIVERGIRDSGALDTEALCILAGEKVWSIRCDVHVMDHGGNLIDCANIAAVTALLHFRRPDVTVMGETVTIHSVTDMQPVPLALHHIPICLTYAFFPINQQDSEGETELVVLDPSLKEECVCQGTLTITVNVHQQICCLQKAGGMAISTDTILKCTQVSKLKVQQLTDMIKKRLKEDEESPARLHLSVTSANPIDVFGRVITKAGAHSDVTVADNGGSSDTKKAGDGMEDEEHEEKIPEDELPVKMEDEQGEEEAETKVEMKPGAPTANATSTAGQGKKKKKKKKSGKKNTGANQS